MAVESVTVSLAFSQHTGEKKVLFRGRVVVVVAVVVGVWGGGGMLVKLTRRRG